MSNYGRGVWHIISQTREGHNILFPSFTFSFSLGGQVTSAQLEMGEGGCAQTSAALTLQGQLDLPKAGPPGSVCLFLFFLSPGTLNFPAVAKAAQASTCPLSAASPSQPRHGTGCSQCPPTKGPGWATGRRCYVCVCVTVANTPRSLAIRGRFRGVSGLGDKERKSGAVFGSGSSRGRAAGGLIC